MPKQREYRFKIDEYLPETMPMKSLLEYLSDVAVLLGEDARVHLINIESGSVSPVVLVDWEAEPSVLERVAKANANEGPEEPIRAIESINVRLRNDNTHASLIGPTQKNVVEFPGVKQNLSKPIEWPWMNQAGTLFGVPIAVGGKNDPVPVHLQAGETVLNLHADRSKAKRIAEYLFSTTLRVTGRGHWQRPAEGGWILERFLIDEFKPVRLVDLDEVTSQLRSIDAAWKSSDDPLATLEQIRHG